MPIDLYIGIAINIAIGISSFAAIVHYTVVKAA